MAASASMAGVTRLCDVKGDRKDSFDVEVHVLPGSASYTTGTNRSGVKWRKLKFDVEDDTAKMQLLAWNDDADYFRSRIFPDNAYRLCGVKAAIYDGVTQVHLKNGSTRELVSGKEVR